MDEVNLENIRLGTKGDLSFVEEDARRDTAQFIEGNAEVKPPSPKFGQSVSEDIEESKFEARAREDSDELRFAANPADEMSLNRRGTQQIVEQIN